MSSMAPGSPGVLLEVCVLPSLVTLELGGGGDPQLVCRVLDPGAETSREISHIPWEDKRRRYE